MGLLDFLFRRRSGPDGSAIEKAIVVHSIAEEYQWLQKHCPDLHCRERVHLRIRGKSYDVLTLHPRKGPERKVYFDISQVAEKKKEPLSN